MLQASWVVGSQGQAFDACWPELVPEPFALALVECQKVVRERVALVCPLATVVVLVRFDWLSVYMKMSYAFIYSLCRSLAAMLSNMCSFLPVGCTLEIAEHGTHRAYPQQSLIREEKDQHGESLTPTPLAIMSS